MKTLSIIAAALLLTVTGCKEKPRPKSELPPEHHELTVVIQQLIEGQISPAGVPSHMKVDTRPTDREYRQDICLYYPDQDGNMKEGSLSCRTVRFDWDQYQSDYVEAKKRLKALGIYDEVEAWAKLQTIGEKGRQPRSYMEPIGMLIQKRTRESISMP